MMHAFLKEFLPNSVITRQAPSSLGWFAKGVNQANSRSQVGGGW